MNGMYDEAIEKFTSFIKSYEGDDKASMEKLAKAHIEGCNFAKEHPTVRRNIHRVELQILQTQILRNIYELFRHVNHSTFTSM